MKANHVPVVERLRNRIYQLERQADENHVKSPSKGNPYWCCNTCGIHDPELSNRGGKHFKGCTMGGIDKQVEHYKRLLEQALHPPVPPTPRYEREVL